MLSDLYNRKILTFASDIPRLGEPEHYDVTATAHSRLCGSTVTVFLAVSDGKITDFGHDVKACALGQASSSILAHHIVGATPDEVRAARETLRQMLKEGAEAPFSGRFEDFNVLEPVRDFKSRHASTLLTLDASVKALDQLADVPENTSLHVNVTA